MCQTPESWFSIVRTFGIRARAGSEVEEINPTSVDMVPIHDFLVRGQFLEAGPLGRTRGWAHPFSLQFPPRRKGFKGGGEGKTPPPSKVAVKVCLKGGEEKFDKKGGG